MARSSGSRSSTAWRPSSPSPTDTARRRVVHAAHGCHRRLLRLLGGYTLQTRNTDSWEGWYWGAKHVWGCENLGQMVPVANVMWDVSKNSDGILFWGCDPETTPWGFNGQLASRLSYWFTELGIKSDLRRARPATTAPPCTPTSGSRCCRTPTPPSTWPSPTSG